MLERTSVTKKQKDGEEKGEEINIRDALSTLAEGAHLSPFTPGLLHISQQQMTQTQRFIPLFMLYRGTGLHNTILKILR